MSIEDEARAEAERRYPATLRYDGDEFPNREAGAQRQGWFERGEWQESRKIEAAQSDTDQIPNHVVRQRDVSAPCWCAAKSDHFFADTIPTKSNPAEAEREALSTGLANYGAEWWTLDDVQHMVSNLTELDDLDRGSIAQEMWTMGAWLKHPKCRNNPKRGNDADYENECAVCKQYLLVVADAILGLSLSQPVQVEVTDEMVEKAALAILNRMTWPSLHWPNLDSLHNRDVRMAMARAALEAALDGGNS